MEQNTNTIDYLQELRKLKDNTDKFPSQSGHTCPNCGYCPHCGRGGYRAPYRTVPFYPAYPDWTWRPWDGPTYIALQATGDQVL